MLFSLAQYWKLKQPDCIGVNTIELQKAISEFRIHTSKYNFLIVVLWLVTLTLIFLKKVYKSSIYDSLDRAVTYLSTVTVFVFFMRLFS